MTPEDLNRLEAACKAASNGNLDSAEVHSASEIVCPMCGDGSIPCETWTNIDDKPIGIEVFGLGEALTNYETFVRLANPAAILELIALARQSVPEGMVMVPREPTDGWEPIETAPRAPTDNWSALGEPIILGFAPDEEGQTRHSCEGYWRPALPDGGNGRTYAAGWVSTLDPHVEPPYLRPTHWQHRPAPPTTQHKEPDNG